MGPLGNEGGLGRSRGSGQGGGTPGCSTQPSSLHLCMASSLPEKRVGQDRDLQTDPRQLPQWL